MVTVSLEVVVYDRLRAYQAEGETSSQAIERLLSVSDAVRAHADACYQQDCYYLNLRRYNGQQA